LSGDRIGRKREAIELHIPQDVEATQIPQIVRDIETAFVAMRYGYVIARKAGIDIVPGSEQQSAIAELHEMGYEIERLADGRIGRHGEQAHHVLILKPCERQPLA